VVALIKNLQILRERTKRYLKLYLVVYDGVGHNILCSIIQVYVCRGGYVRCPYCNHEETKVVDSRQDGNVVRRRRECEKCGKRFTTYERVEELPLFVKKKDGRREPFNRDKLRRSIIIACNKRPVSSEQIERLVNSIESKIRFDEDNEISTNKIGRMVMNRLKRLDPVAYIRFASVYYEFDDVDAFEKALAQFKKR